MVIKGNNLSVSTPSLTKVTFTPQIDAQVLFLVTSTEIDVVVHRGASSGPVVVTVQGVVSNQVTFSVISGFTPSVDSLNIFVDGTFDYPLDQLVVRMVFGSGISDAQSVAGLIGAQVVGYLPECNSFLFQVSPSPGTPDAQQALINQVIADSRVASALRNYGGHQNGTVDSDLAHFGDRGQVWAYDRIQAQGGWDQLGGGIDHFPVTIGVVDFGFCIDPHNPASFTHPQFLNLAAGQSISSEPIGMAATDQGLGPSHGTAVAGIIGANNRPSVNPGVDINGILSAPGGPYILNVYRVGDSGLPRGRMWNAIVGISHARRDGAKVICTTLGWTSGIDLPVALYPLLQQQYAVALASMPDVLVVIAAGNESAPARNIAPACMTGAFAWVEPNGRAMAEVISNSLIVGGTDHDDLRWRRRIGIFLGSNYGPEVTIWAPAVNVYAASLDALGVPTHALFAGTSMAAPMVAGTAGLLLSVNNNLTVSQLKDLLISNGSAITIDDPANPGGVIQARRLNVCRSVAAVLGQNVDDTCGGRIAVSANDSGTVSYFTISDHGTGINYLGTPPGGVLHPIGVSQDGTKYAFPDSVFVNQQTQFSLEMRGLAGSFSQSINTPPPLNQSDGPPVWHPSGGRILYSSESTIVSANLGTSAIAGIVNMNAGTWGMSPTGGRLFYGGDVIAGPAGVGNISVATFSNDTGAGIFQFVSAHGTCDYTSFNPANSFLYPDTVFGQGGTIIGGFSSLPDSASMATIGYGSFTRPDPANPGSFL